MLAYFSYEQEKSKKNIKEKYAMCLTKNNELSVYVYLGIYLLIAFQIYASFSV